MRVTHPPSNSTGGSATATSWTTKRRSVAGGTVDAAGGGGGARGHGRAAGVDAGGGRIEAPPRRPRAKLLHLLPCRHRYRNDVFRGVDEGDVEQRGQPAAGTDLGARPVLILRPLCRRSEAVGAEVHAPDAIA